MESYKAALINEIEKLYRRKKAIVVVILAVGVIGAVQLLSIGLRGGLGIIGITSSVFPVTVLSVFSNTILPLFTALVIIDLFTGEFANETMKITITKPVTRLKIYLAKLSATGFFVLANLLLVMILSIFVGLIFNTFTFTLTGLYNIVISYIVTFFPVMTLAVMIAFLANIFKSSSAVFFLSIIAFAFLKVVGLVFAPISGILVTSLMDWYKLWIASSLPFLTISRLTLVMAAHILIFFALGYSRFEKRSL